MDRRKNLAHEIELFQRWLSAVAYEELGVNDSAAVFFESVLSPTLLYAQELIRFGIPFSFAHFRLGNLYTQLEQFDRAEEHYLTFLKTFTQPDPEYEYMVTEARAALETLERER